MKRDRIEPRILKGFRDTDPPSEIMRQKVLTKIRRVYDAFGYLPLDSPAQEYLEVLTGKYGDEATVQLFRFRDAGGREVGLRFDLTVPLARYVAMNPELPLPWKRQQCALVWRAEKPGPGRFREFLQYDIDVIGTREMTADAEIVQVMAATMRALGIERFQIQVNNRKILNGLGEWLGIDERKVVLVVRAIDKLAKIQWEGVEGELTAPGGPGLSAGLVKKVRAYLDTKQESSPQTLQALGQLLRASAMGREGVAELTQIWQMVEAAGLADKVVIDPTIARGLDYYTGPVFETTLLDCPEIGSVFSGGRFDDLVRMFSDRDVPGVGTSIGVDRLITGLTKLKMIEAIPYVAPVIILVQDQTLLAELVKLGSELREAGISNELYLGQASLSDQLRYAGKRSLPWAIVCGGNELGSDTVVLRDMQSRKQEKVPRSQLIEVLRQKLQ